jgi:hypothetical protein
MPKHRNPALCYAFVPWLPPKTKLALSGDIMADQCPLCGAFNDYITETFFSVECTTSGCGNYSEKATDRWIDELRLSLQNKKQEVYGTVEESVDVVVESGQSSFDFFEEAPQGTD